MNIGDVYCSGALLRDLSGLGQSLQLEHLLLQQKEQLLQGKFYYGICRDSYYSGNSIAVSEWKVIS
jgi:hypothetical protein